MSMAVYGTPEAYEAYTKLEKRMNNKYWILFTHYECPACGRESEVIRTRVHNINESGHEYKNDYDYCLEH